LADLIGREDKATVLPKRARTALAEQIARHGCYPALVVRQHPKRPGKYEILDGHHRAEILRALGWKTARCEVWPVDGEGADLAAATLDRLRGRPDAKKAARQTRQIVQRFGRDGAAARLGITPAGLRQQLAVAHSPRPQIDGPAMDLHPVVFHLSGADMARLSDALRKAGGGGLPRSEALMRVVSRSSGPGDTPS